MSHRRHGFEVLLPIAVAAAVLAAWHLTVRRSGSNLYPTPIEVLSGLLDLARRGVLLNYIVASLFRVSWGLVLAVCVGVPLGLTLGWFRPAAVALNPLIQVLRPISPIAWIPIAILWFGLKDSAPIFLIFLSSVFPITVSAMASVQSIPLRYLRAAANFGLRRTAFLRHVLLPAALPQIVTGIRVAVGVSWMVVVAAEMIAVNSGLGYLIIDARNAGKRYDLVVAGMAVIGVIGLWLDFVVRQVEKLDDIRWAREL